MRSIFMLAYSCIFLHNFIQFYFISILTKINKNYQVLHLLLNDEIFWVYRNIYFVIKMYDTILIKAWVL